ncbi:MAG: hypothetical protein AAGB25_01300 [Pseudomonadota bacterium]
MLALRIFALYFLLTLVLCSIVLLVDFGVYILLALLCATVLTLKALFVDYMRKRTAPRDAPAETDAAEA